MTKMPELCGPTRATTEDVAKKRYVAAGDRAYSIGTVDGGFPPMGTRITGEMGGVWAPPIKLLHGFWFALNGVWLPAAQRFTSGPGYVQLHYPEHNGIAVTRTEFAPDGYPALVVALTLHNETTAQQQVSVQFATRSQLLGTYPWSETTPTADALNRQDAATYDAASGTLIFHTAERPWCAVIGASVQPTCGATADSWGPVDPAQRQGYSQAQSSAGGQLDWDLDLPAGQAHTLWLVIAGSHIGHSVAQETLRHVLADPAGLLREKMHERSTLLAQTQFDVPDTDLMQALPWATLNMADLRRTVTDVHIRDVNSGKDYPPPLKTIARLSGIGDGFPDYPSFYGTGSGYIVYPLLAAGMWQTAMDHLRVLRDVSRIINGATGKVVHEILCDGSVYFGNNAAPGNTNETALFATATELLWRWSGDETFRDEMYAFVRDGMRYITTDLDGDGDGWPEGNGIAEREGMGAEHIDVAANTWQALRALARMADRCGDTATAAWASQKAAAMQSTFEAAWWVPEKSLYADSLCHLNEAEQPDVAHNQQLQQGIWVSVVPMEIGFASAEHAHAALDTLETPAYSNKHRLYLVGEGGGADGKAEKKCWTVMAGVMALAEANYGRVGAEQALGYMRAIATLIDLEQPGALPEVAPSPEYDPFTEFTERLMFMQAWSSYGISWTLVRCLLGIDADIPAGQISVVPQLPPEWPRLAVRRLRVGQGVIAVATERTDHGFCTSVEAPPGLQLMIGHTLTAEHRIEAVTLDGVPVQYDTVTTLRGREVRVATTTDAARVLDVRTSMV